ncbi:MAG: SagB/ThcOx family dehydrogenase [Marinibacterium sp.]|nr:SagB/ThcOx family dehydrogenase [Marinibacterium sp.]
MIRWSYAAEGQPQDADDAATLYRLDRIGALDHTLWHGDIALITLRPRRAPPPETAPATPPRLSDHVVLHQEAGQWIAEHPAGWARLHLHDPRVSALLHALALGQPSDALPEDAQQGVIALLHRAGCLHDGRTTGWGTADLWAHHRSRLGHDRAPLGKTGQSAPAIAAPHRVHATLPLPAVDMAALARTDPPLASAIAGRRSQRQHGARPLSTDQISEFLARTLRPDQGRWPYPSGGGIHGVRGYLALHAGLDLPAGLYAYAPEPHALLSVAQSGAGLNRLLQDAARAAGVDELPQALLILAAPLPALRRAYGDLAYGLAVKEVGAILQTGMLAASAMDLAACPLGTGNSTLFAALLGADPLAWTSLGEMMLGTS